MKQQRFITTAVSLAFCLLMHAQTVNDKPVKRITFDREQVTIVYKDGATETVADKATVKGRIATGITAARRTEGKRSSAASSWYTLDGRRTQPSAAKRGVYVVRENDKVRKVIKK